MKHKLPKPRFIAGTYVLEKTLERAGCVDAARIANDLAKDFDARGLALVQTHVIDNRPECPTCSGKGAHWSECPERF